MSCHRLAFIMRAMGQGFQAHELQRVHEQPRPSPDVEVLLPSSGKESVKVPTSAALTARDSLYQGAIIAESCAKLLTACLDGVDQR